MTAPHYKDVLAGMSERLPYEQAVRDFIFYQRNQALTPYKISNPSIGYLDRILSRPGITKSYGVREDITQKLKELPGKKEEKYTLFNPRALDQLLAYKS